MDVRCERCRAQYVFDDEQVTPSGLTVQCTNCGHVFRVKKKELVVTVAVKPGELEGTPLPATAAAPRQPGQAAAAGADQEPPREWRVRLASGEVLAFRELTTLQKWIVEQRVSRDDEISGGGEGFRRLGSIAELAPFFQVVEAAERGKQKGSTEPQLPARPAAGGPPLPPPPSGFPPPSFAQRPPPAPPPPPPASQPTLALPAAPPAPPPQAVGEIVPGREGPAGQARRPERRGTRVALALVLLAVAAGAAAYVFGPALVARRAARQVPPAELEVRGSPARAAEPAADTPVRPERSEAASAAERSRRAAASPEPPTPTQTATATPTPTSTSTETTPPPETAPPAPVAEPPAPATPRGPRALLAEADRLRERGGCERALELYGRLLDRNPEHVRALTGRGLCYLDLEQYGPAEASFEAALAAEPGDADGLLGLAETLRWQGRTAEAITYYEKYLAEHPDGEEAAVARNAVETLRR